uniref:Family with sequence similarity 71 member F2 n=1 Tax=Chrysemys picta bellii TaxID=8478 RepID=A0A8C3HY12_CHRPI
AIRQRSLTPARREGPPAELPPQSAIAVTKQGNWVDIHNAPTLVTLGVTSSEPCLPLPNVLLIARLPAAHSCPWGLGHPVLSLGSRLLPLRYVRLSVQDSGRRLLRVQVVTGKVYYLRLHQAHPDAVFTLWSRLADILQWGLSITTKDPSIHVPHSLVLSVGSSSTSSPAQVHSECSKSLLIKEGNKCGIIKLGSQPKSHPTHSCCPWSVQPQSSEVHLQSSPPSLGGRYGGTLHSRLLGPSMAGPYASPWGSAPVFASHTSPLGIH